MNVPSGLQRAAGVLRRRGLTDAAVLLAGLVVGLAFGQLVGLANLGAASVVGPALAAVVVGVAVVLAVGLRAAGTRRTPYW